MIPNNTLKNVYLNRTAAFLPNTPVGNDAIEAVLGMAVWSEPGMWDSR